MVEPKQIKDVLKQIEALKTSETSADYQEGIDDAKQILNTFLQELLDRERINQLESELALLRAKYQSDGQTVPKKRGRKPKTVEQTPPELSHLTP